MKQTTEIQLREIFWKVHQCSWGCSCCGDLTSEIDKELEVIFQDLLAVLSNKDGEQW